MMAENTLYQYGTLSSLLAGAMDGSKSINDLLKHGDFGIGTLDGSDGELMIIEGQAFHARQNGDVVKLSGNETVPYAAVTYFDPEYQFPLVKDKSSQEIGNLIYTHLTSVNLFAAIQIKGTFKKMHVRVVPKQQKPYRPFSAIVQPEFRAENISGTIVGFYTPELFHGAAVAGYHLHFLSDDGQFGGHIMDYELEKGIITMQTMTEYTQGFPMVDNFLNTTFDVKELLKEIEVSE